MGEDDDNGRQLLESLEQEAYEEEQKRGKERVNQRTGNVPRESAGSSQSGNEGREQPILQVEVRGPVVGVGGLSKGSE